MVSGAWSAGRTTRGDGSPAVSKRAMDPLAVLANPARQYLVFLLCTGETTSGDLATMAYDSYGIGWSSVSEHLSVLHDSGFVDLLVDGPRRWYRLRDDWWDRVDDSLAELRTAWHEHAPTRELGFGADVFPARARRGMLPAPGDAFAGQSHARRSTTRGRRGKNQSELGVGRSHWSEYADGSYGLE